MFDGRHCIEEDYVLLVKETGKIILHIANHSNSLDSKIRFYLTFISRFDPYLAESLSRKIIKDDITSSETIDIINQYIDILKQQVLVDIKEHN